MSDATASARAQPFYCPFCGEEDFVPDPDQVRALLCNSCLRRYRIDFLGVAAREDETASAR